MAAENKTSGYVVVAPLVQAVIGDRVLHFYKGDVLPGGISAESLQNLKELGFVESTGAKASDDDEKAGYDSLKVDELKEEIERRNSDREDDAKLPTDGKKAELVAALEADDAAGDN
jgi:hypothetical protein